MAEPADGGASEASRRAQPRRLLSNALANYAGQLTTLIVGIGLTPVIVSRLGRTGFGVWALVVALQGLLGLADFGITGSVIRYVSHHHARGETSEINRVVSSLFGLHIVLGLVAGVITACLAQWGLPLLNLGGEESLEQARQALMIASAGLVVALPASVLGSVLIGLRRYELSNVVTVGQTVVTAAATLLALEQGHGAPTLILINAVGLAVGHLIRFALAKRQLPAMRIELRLANRATVREISGYSVWLFVLDIAQRMFYNADAVVIAALLPVAAVTDFNLGFRAASSVSYLSGPAVAVLLPAAAAFEARAAAQELARVLAAGTRLACAVTIPAVLWLTLWGHQVMHVWLGSRHGDAVGVLWIFLVVFLVGAAQNAAATILRGTGHVRALAVTVGVEYVANLGLSVILVPHLGAIGAAVGTLVPAVIVGLGIIPLLACRALGLPYAAYVLRPIAAPLLAALPVAGILLLLHIVLSGPSLSVIAAAGTASLILYAGSYWWFAAGSEEQRLVRLMGARLGRAVGRDGRGDRAQHRHPDPEPSGVAAADPVEPAPADGGPWVV